MAFLRPTEKVLVSKLGIMLTLIFKHFFQRDPSIVTNGAETGVSASSKLEFLLIFRLKSE